MRKLEEDERNKDEKWEEHRDEKKLILYYGGQWHKSKKK
jgi:hypothetical protein